MPGSRGKSNGAHHHIDGLATKAEKMAMTSNELLAPISSVPSEFKLLDRYWRASNYLSVGQVSTVLLKKRTNLKLHCFTYEKSHGQHSTIVDAHRFTSWIQTPSWNASLSSLMWSRDYLVISERHLDKTSFTAIWINLSVRGSWIWFTFQVQGTGE